jgi:hypothetical protein
MGESVETGTVGGGSAIPVGDEFARFLSQLLQSGQFGNVPAAQIDPETGQPISQPGVAPGPIDRTQGIAQALNDIVQGPDVTGQQSAVQQIIQQQSTRDVADLRERFTAGGGSQGTPSAVAEGIFRSETAPKLAAATGALDLQASQQQIQALIPILQVLSQFAGRGVPQAAPFVEVKEGPLSSIGGLLGGVASAGPAIAGLFKGGADNVSFGSPRFGGTGVNV